MGQEQPMVTGLPRLDAGKHEGPEQGACLMEYVSLLAGQRFTDRPACTPPAVAVVARRVNDAVSDPARPRLARWAPELISPGGRQAGLDDTVVLCCAATGLSADPQGRHLSDLQQRARWRLRHAWLRWLRLPGQAAVHEAFLAATAVLAPLSPDERDERLIGLLADVARAARAATDGPRRRSPDGPRPVGAPGGGALATERGHGGGQQP